MLSQSSFRGGFFSQETGKDRIPASIVIHEQGVQAYSDRDPNHVVAIDWQSMLLEKGGAEKNMFFVSNTHKTLTIVCSAEAFFDTLKAHAPPQAHVVFSFENTQQKHRRFQQTGWALLLVSIMLLGWGMVALWKILPSYVVQQVPFEFDQKIGKLALTQMSEHRLEDQRLVSTVEQIVHVLEPYAPLPQGHYDVRVYESDQVNAFALPGGHIVVLSGLLKKAQSPEEVAGVLGHEMIHVTHRHGIRHIVRSLGVMTFAQLMFGDVVGMLAVGKELITMFSLNQYSQDLENDADLGAVRVLAKAGINPNALADFFALLEHEEKNMPDMPNFLSTHPDLTQRIQTVHQAARSLEPIAEKPMHVAWSSMKTYFSATTESEHGR